MLAACSSSGERRTASTGFLDIEGVLKSTVTITVHFKESASKADMARVVAELSNDLDNGRFADIPIESAAFYEEHRLVMGWAATSSFSHEGVTAST